MDSVGNFFSSPGKPVARFGRYLLALLIFLLFYFPVTGILIAQVEGVAGKISTPRFEPLAEVMILIALRTMCGLAGILLSLALIIREPFRHMIARPWQRVAGNFLMCFSIYIGLVLLKDVVVGMMTGTPVRFNQGFFVAENMTLYAVALLFAFVMVPLQSLVEEVVFRSFVGKGFSGLLNRRWFLMLASGILFSLNHGGQDLLYWLLLSVFLIWSVVKSNSIIYAWAIHAGHNFYYMFILSGGGADKDSMTIFLQPRHGLSLWLELIAVVLTLMLLGRSLGWRLKWEDFAGRAAED